MDKSYVPCILTELRFVKSQMRDLSPNRTYINLPKEDFITFMSRAIALIEWLDGALEDCEEAAEEDEEALEYWKKRCSELVRDRDSVVEHWTNHCENLFHTHRKSLAEKDREIYKLKQELNSLYGKINSPDNFCGNCKHFSICPNKVGICNNKHADPFIVDPDDTSCEYFESNQVDRDKPEFPCCEHCSHEDCDDCTLCPF